MLKVNDTVIFEGKDHRVLWAYNNDMLEIEEPGNCSPLGVKLVSIKEVVLGSVGVA